MCITCALGVFRIHGSSFIHCSAISSLLPRVPVKHPVQYRFYMDAFLCHRAGTRPILDHVKGVEGYLCRD